MMNAEDVVQVVDALEEAELRTWLDGGWGVDALLGRQTRVRHDLGRVISLDHVKTAKTALAPLGLTVEEDELPTRLVVRDGHDRSGDLHTVSFDSDGGGTQRLQDGISFRYPPKGFEGWGLVGGRHFRCLTPEVQLLVHLGYEPSDIDYRDMRLLRERFGISLPPP